MSERAKLRVRPCLAGYQVLTVEGGDLTGIYEGDKRFIGRIVKRLLAQGATLERPIPSKEPQ